MLKDFTVLPHVAFGCAILLFAVLSTGCEPVFCFCTVPPWWMTWGRGRAGPRSLLTHFQQTCLSAHMQWSPLNCAWTRKVLLYPLIGGTAPVYFCLFSSSVHLFSFFFFFTVPSFLSAFSAFPFWEDHVLHWQEPLVHSFLCNICSYHHHCVVSFLFFLSIDYSFSPSFPTSFLSPLVKLGDLLYSISYVGGNVMNARGTCIYAHMHDLIVVHQICRRVIQSRIKTDFCVDK